MREALYRGGKPTVVWPLPTGFLNSRTSYMGRQSELSQQWDMGQSGMEAVVEWNAR